MNSLDMKPVAEILMFKAIKTLEITRDDGWEKGLEKFVPVFALLHKQPGGERAIKNAIKTWSRWFPENCNIDEYRQRFDALMGPPIKFDHGCKAKDLIRSFKND